MGNKRQTLFGLLFLLVACSSNLGGGDDPGPPITEILEIRLLPRKTVSSGDYLTVICVVKDSLRSDLRYSWKFGNELPFATDTNSVKLKIDFPPQEDFAGRVVVFSDQDNVSQTVRAEFTIDVAE